MTGILTWTVVMPYRLFAHHQHPPKEERAENIHHRYEDTDQGRSWQRSSSVELEVKVRNRAHTKSVMDGERRVHRCSLPGARRRCWALEDKELAAIWCSRKLRVGMVLVAPGRPYAALLSSVPVNTPRMFPRLQMWLAMIESTPSTPAIHLVSWAVTLRSKALVRARYR